MFERWFTQMSVVATVMLSLPVVGWCCYGYRPLEEQSPTALARNLVEFSVRAESADQEAPYVNRVIAVMQSHGQASVDALVQQRSRMEKDNTAPAVLAKFDQLIDRVARQRGARHSRLFWHTSLKQAQEQARETNRPILSLRLLGHLDKDRACANSRLFRTMLYPDPKISKALREQFVLHWEPVREVPMVTIDFGDERTIQRPLTGNSLHMVMDSQATPIDVMPGLVSPAEFAAWLGEMHQLCNQSTQASDDRRREIVSNFHRQRATKRRADSPLAIKTNQRVSDLNPLDRRWNALAAKHQTIGLSEKAARLVAHEAPKARAAMPIAVSKMVMETPLLKVVRTLSPSVAHDTAFNLYGIQPKIDDMFCIDQPLDRTTLIEQIYSDVFLMPLDDPWLGIPPESESLADEVYGNPALDLSQWTIAR